MIVMQLSSRTGFSSKMQKTLLRLISKFANQGTYQDALLCLVYLCQTQDIKKLSNAVCVAVINFPYVQTISEKEELICLLTVVVICG
jgi:hypothetical protein